tara:strand:+ start:4524 stop:5513 length:990 start_codon:yes stop_codon:yes gene_type:complete
MILKSTIVENNLSTLKDYNPIIFYGENEGLKNDLKEQIKIKAKTAEIITLFQEEILQKKNLLEKETSNLSLFESKKIILINEANDKLYDIIIDINETNSKDCKIIIFSDVLEKRSKLRSYFEKNNKVGIIACYKDNKAQLKDYILKRLSEFKGVNNEIIEYLIENSNHEREIIRNEITKIEGYFIDKIINRSELEQLLNYKKTSNINELINASLLKNRKDLNTILGNQLIFETDIFNYLFKLDQKISILLQIKINQKDSENSLSSIIEKMRPPIFWKDKPDYTNISNIWSLKKLEKLKNKISEIELIMKSKSEIKKEIILKKLLVEIAE